MWPTVGLDGQSIVLSQRIGYEDIRLQRAFIHKSVRLPGGYARTTGREVFASSLPG